MHPIIANTLQPLFASDSSKSFMLLEAPFVLSNSEVAFAYKIKMFCRIVIDSMKA